MHVWRLLFFTLPFYFFSVVVVVETSLNLQQLAVLAKLSGQRAPRTHLFLPHVVPELGVQALMAMPGF